MFADKGSNKEGKKAVDSNNETIICSCSSLDFGSLGKKGGKSNTVNAFWYTEPSRRGKMALGNGSAALSRLM